MTTSAFRSVGAAAAIVAARLRQPRVVLLMFVVCSFCFWTGWELRRHAPHPYHDLSEGQYSDHFSHLNAARIFPRIGLDLWRKSLETMFRPLSPGELSRLPPDAKIAAGPEVRFVPGWPAGKPLIASWSHNPRLYPPGDLLLVAPIALAYHFTSLTFSGATLALVILFLAYTHASLGMAFSTATHDAPRALALGLVYFETIHWTLEGFYDAAAIGPIVLCASALSRRRGLVAAVAFAAAVFIHFRSLFFLPWGVYALWVVVREREWQRWKAADLAVALAGCAMVAASATAFVLIWPALGTLPIGNPISMKVHPPDWHSIGAFAVVTLACALAFAFAKSWLDLALVGWFAVMLFELRETYPWHITIPMAWLAAPVIGAAHRRCARRAWLVTDARIFVVLFVAGFVFKGSGLPSWLVQLF